MFRAQAQSSSSFYGVIELLEQIFYCAVRNMRKSHGNAVFGMVMNVIQATLILVIFIFMFDILGMRRLAVRGDFVLYVMSGVFVFLTHTKAVGAVAGADAPASAMMMHRPMNPVIAICGAALSSLYEQTLAAAVVLFLYSTLYAPQPITIFDPVEAIAIYLLAWISGVVIGLIFYAAKPWQPDVVGILSTIYMRANMIASGKMIAANYASPRLRGMFDWNPLFHTIDQARGAIFLNYNPRYTTLDYPIYTTMLFALIGLMGVFFTRKYASASWGKRR